MDIVFLSPTGGTVAALQDAGEGEWPVVWDNPADASSFSDYFDGMGPDSPDWETVEITTGPGTSDFIFVDENGQKWLPRHLIPDGAERLSDEAIALAQRHVWMVYTADAATKVVADLKRGQLNGEGCYAVLIHDAENVAGGVYRAVEQFESAWARMLAAEQAAGRGVAPAEIDD